MPSSLRQRLLLGTVALAVGVGGYRTVRGFEPRSSEPPLSEPRELHWIARYERAAPALRHDERALFLHSRESKGKTRFFRAQLILTPTRLVPRSDVTRVLNEEWPEMPILLDFRRQDEFRNVAALLRSRAKALRLEVEVEHLDRGLLLMRRAAP